MKNMTISKKLILGFGIILVMLALTIGISIYSLKGIEDEIDNYGKYTLPNSVDILQVEMGFVSVQRYIAEAIGEPDVNKAITLFDKAQKEATILLTRLERYSANQRDSTRDDDIKKVQNDLAKAGILRKEIAELIKNPEDDSIYMARQKFNENYLPILNKSMSVLDDFKSTSDARAAQQDKDAKDAVRFALLVLIACGSVTVLLTIVMIIIIRGSILTPVKEIGKVYEKISKGNMNTAINYESKDELGQMAKLIQKTNQMQNLIIGDVIDKFTKISQGDLRLKVDLDYPGDYGILKETIENTVSALNHTMQIIDTAAEQVSTGSAQVSSGAQALAAGSAEQASSVEELTVSIGKIAEEAEENSQNVKIANEFVEQAGKGVKKGNDHMSQLTEAMTEIGSASNQIANITKVIGDIAFQTNILALNAAIEAARAGNAGKGFAVVADEVRSLAAKSAEAAKQTEELIQNSVATVSKGSQITAQTAQILQEVGRDTLKVTESFVKIDESSAEQANAIEQIKQGLTQVSSVVQTNAATAEENSATSEEMSAQAATLREEVGKFELASGYEKENIHDLSLLKELPEKEAAIAGLESSLGKY